MNAFGTQGNWRERDASTSVASGLSHPFAPSRAGSPFSLVRHVHEAPAAFVAAFARVVAGAVMASQLVHLRYRLPDEVDLPKAARCCWGG
jgi:hypothetical protein